MNNKGKIIKYILELLVLFILAFYIFEINVNPNKSFEIESCESCITHQSVGSKKSPSGNWLVRTNLVESEGAEIMTIGIVPLYLDNNYKEMIPISVPQNFSGFVMWDTRPQYQDVLWVFSTGNSVQARYYTYSENGVWVANEYQTGPHATACIPQVKEIPEVLELFEACTNL